jgi:putative transposase
MECKKAYKFRLYPDAKRQAEIDQRLILAQKFYNKLLEKSIKAYAKGNKSVSMASFNRSVKEIITENEDYLKLYSQTRCEIEYRLKKAYSNFFRRCKTNKGKKGFPRFKSRDKYNSLTYPQDNGSFSIEKNRLRVSRIGTMQIELHRSIEGQIKTVTIKREAGKYYAIFTTSTEKVIPEVKNTNPVGIDVGLKTFAVLSDGTAITKPNFRKDSRKHIARWQRIVARRKKGSHRRQKAKERLNREYQIANNQQEDYLHKVTNQLVNSGYTSFAMEKLQVQNMVRNHNLAKSISDASWSKFKQLLSYKAESAGMEVIEVNPKDTSKTCSDCGNIQEMPLSKRTFLCDRCGMQKDRDYNASINILRKTTAGHAGSHAQGDKTSAMQKASASHIDELRTYSGA